MLERWVEATLRNRLVVTLLFLALLGVGARALFTLEVDAFPDTTPIQVQVNTVAPALSPEEIERQISFPIESTIAGLPGLTNVRSVSKFGFSQVVATFSDEVSMLDARQLELVGAFCPVTLHDRERSAASLATARQTIDLLADAGAPVLVLAEAGDERRTAIAGRVPTEDRLACSCRDVRHRREVEVPTRPVADVDDLDIGRVHRRHRLEQL